MNATNPATKSRPTAGSWSAAGLASAMLLIALQGGCTAISNPVARGVPVRLLPEELLVPQQEPKCIIPLTLLRQNPPDQYRFDEGDVLGIYIEGVLPTTTPTQPTPPTPPVYFPAQISSLGRRLPPATGYPFTVQKDGTILLPIVKPLSVRGLTLPEVEAAVRNAYDAAGILLKEKKPNILVSLMQQRQTRVLVFREEIGGFTSGGIGILATSSKRGTGHLVDLPAYENDILSAMAQTGGLPGLDAYDCIVVFKGGQNIPGLVPGLQATGRCDCPNGVAAQGVKVVKIQLRMAREAVASIKPEDILLQSGDVVFLEGRETERFYTGGLLPAAEFEIPRDRDLDVIEAISLVKGPLLNGALGGSNLTGTLLEDGIGNPSPSLLTVLRRLPDRSVLPIRVDLTRALCDPRERILVKAGDVLILQEKPYEALARYTTKTLINFSGTYQFIHSKFFNGVVDISAPNRIPGRISLSAPTP